MAARDLAEPSVSRAAAPVAPAPRWVGRDWLVFLALVVVTALSRLPFRTQMIYAWDGGLFAQALRDYNVVPHHPQPPGYIFYVGVGKLIGFVTGWGPNAVLVLRSASARRA